MSESNDFFSEIRANPEDLVSRQIYADWLEEEGDPLAELIRLQCELAELTDTAPEWAEMKDREKVLLEIYLERWVKPLKEEFGAINVVVRAGFVDSLRVDTGVFIENAEKIIGMLPGLCALSLGRPRRHLAELLRVPQLRQLRRLDLRHAKLTDEDASALLDSLQTPELVELNLSGNQLTASGARTIAQCEMLGRLKCLDLSGNLLADDGAAELADSSVLKGLQQLSFRKCLLHRQGFSHLMTRRGLPRLGQLNLADNDLSGLQPWTARSTGLLQSLNVRCGRLDISDMQLLAGSKDFASLQTLDASANDSGLEGIEAILSSTLFRQLRRLVVRNAGNLSWRQPTDVNFSRTFQFADLPLAHVDFHASPISDEAIIQLAEAGGFRLAETIRLNRTGIGLPGVAAILNNSPRLERLHAVGHERSELRGLLKLLETWDGLGSFKELAIDEKVLAYRLDFKSLVDVGRLREDFRICAAPGGTGLRWTDPTELTREYGPEFLRIVKWT